MMYWLKYVLLAALVFIVFVNFYRGKGTVLVVSTVDGKAYRVLDRPDNLEAANMLAKLHGDLGKLIKHMMAKFPKDKDVASLYDRYKREALEEGRFDTSNTSFSINKGERIVLCLRQSNGNFVEYNTLKYVALHELGHVMSPTIGHDDRFWSNMQRLVRNATEIKLYDYVDYSKTPQKYCGIHITSSV